jgi:hypothetical protein
MNHTHYFLTDEIYRLVERREISRIKKISIAREPEARYRSKLTHQQINCKIQLDEKTIYKNLISSCMRYVQRGAPSRGNGELQDESKEAIALC